MSITARFFGGDSSYRSGILLRRVRLGDFFTPSAMSANSRWYSIPGVGFMDSTCCGIKRGPASRASGELAGIFTALLLLGDITHVLTGELRIDDTASVKAWVTHSKLPTFLGAN